VLADGVSVGDVVCGVEKQEPFMPVGDTYLHVSNPTLHGSKSKHQRGTLTWMAEYIAVRDCYFNATYILFQYKT
jgi:hypothetical protein